MPTSGMQEVGRGRRPARVSTAGAQEVEKGRDRPRPLQNHGGDMCGGDEPYGGAGKEGAGDRATEKTKKMGREK